MYILPFLVSTVVAVLSSRCRPRCPLATLPAVHHSCCPLLPLSSPSVVRSSYETKQKHAKHCSSPVHLTPSFTFFTLPLSSSDRCCPSFLICLTGQRRYFERSETSALPLSSSDRFYPSFLLIPYKQCEDDITIQLYNVVITCLDKHYLL